MVTMKYASLDLGTIEAVFNKLGGIEGAQAFLRSETEIVTKKHIIDCDADPFCPDGWEVEEHNKGGQFKWSPEAVRLHLSPNQQGSKVIEGNKLRKELAKEPVLNANVLDYLLKNSQLIPDEWKDKFVFFWGTIYRYSDGHLGVRYLRWCGDGWYWSYRWLSDDWSGGDPAAVSASN